jgi:2,3-dihydroxybiphenyl 1,2-dioxygenase
MGNSLFGRVRLGYVLAESGHIEKWQRFALQGLGMHVETPQGDELVIRLDDYARRLIVRRGPAEDVVATGWEFDDQPAIDTALDRLKGIGQAPKFVRGEEAKLRGVTEFWSVVGPKGTSIELFKTPVKTNQPLQMQTSGFLTGKAGLGHMAITTREPQAMQRFWEYVFDARVSDRIDDRLNGVDMDFTFLRVNERHHTLAIASTRGLKMNPLRTSIHHLNVQVAQFDDVVEAYRRCRALGYPIASGIGQHPNDKELSFYVETPSGFEIEVGWNPLVVSEEAERSWQPGKYRGISLWGHFPESLTLGLKVRRIARGLMSLTRKEYKVDGLK